MKEKNLDKLGQKYLQMKPLGNEDAIAARREYARRQAEHWQDIFAHGCNDPAWTDGCNLNLVRNHIIAELTGLENLGVDVSNEWVPPKVDNGLMVPAGKWYESRCRHFAQTGHRVRKASAEITLF